MLNRTFAVICVVSILIAGSFVIYAEETDVNISKSEDNTTTFSRSTLVTSSGITFDLTDIEVYIEDFDGINIETSQGMIDYIYEVGVYNSRTRDEQITIFGKSLTPDELALIIQHPLYAKRAYDCSQTAISTASMLYPDCHSDGELGNAFQHAYWLMLLYYDTTPSFAIDFVVAHENYDGNPILHKTMDLFNDYAAYYFCIGTIGTDFTEATLAFYTKDLMDDGELKYIVFDYEYISRIVYNSITETTQTYYSTADLYAYTNSNTPYNIPEPIYEVFPAGSSGPIIKP
ncbi:MAG: hypothetical protein E7594_03870 [Ruminococcaceae bacterium]|nr:hypothetical protein [Oscillospiraceae bacterium]